MKKFILYNAKNMDDGLKFLKKYKKYDSEIIIKRSKNAIRNVVVIVKF